MARRSQRSRRRSSGIAPVLYGTVTLLVFGVFAGLIVAGMIYLPVLDTTVRGQFEGKRWAVPARVYARPLELYVGKPMTPEQFARELAILHYRPAAQPVSPGTFARRGNEFHVVTRSFVFWDSREPSLPIRVRFEGGQLVSLTRSDTGRDTPLVRLDPLEIGGIYPAHNEDRILVQLKEVPPQLVQALLAVEDRDFYVHRGVSPLAIMRALWTNIRAGGTVQGGSTITQQLVKNFYLSNERTLVRKINEAIMAVLLEWHYSKDEILEAYLNEVYLGQDGKRAIHGFGLGSQFYFNSSLDELNISEIALLVALVKGPSYYDPRRHPERALGRRNVVLDVLAEQGVIPPAQAAAAKKTPLGVTHRASSGVTQYPAFLDLVRRQLRRDYRDEDLSSEGLRIFTTLDPLAQDAAEKALAKHLPELEKRQRLPKGRLEGAVVVTSIDGGEVLAVVGGRDSGFAGFNRALDALRPIGSLVKPAVYLTALAQPERFTLATLLDDGPLSLTMADGQVWEPHNYDRTYHGTVPLYSALAHSYNLSTARLGLAVGVPQVAKTLRRLGVERDLNIYPSLFLGATALAPYDVAQMYQTLANGGFRTPLRAIREVLAGDGKPLQRYALTVEQGFDPAPVYLVNMALRKVVEEGTARGAKAMLPPGMTVAGKTGTTNDTRDSWFAGFSGDRVAVVWLGLDDNSPIRMTGATGALPIWGTVMRDISTRPLHLVRPGNVDYAWIEPASGLQVYPGCSGAVQLPFISGSEPDQGACGQSPFGQTVEGTLEWIRGIMQ